MASRVNVGVIGTGRIGQLHTEHLACRIPAADVLVVSTSSRRRPRNVPPTAMSPPPHRTTARS